MQNGGFFSGFGHFDGCKSFDRHRFFHGYFHYNNTMDRSTFQNSTSTLTMATTKTSTTITQDVSTSITSTTTTNNTTTNTINKWVINITSTPHTQALKAQLARGPNFTIVPRYPLKETYNAAVEEVCMKLPTWRLMS